MKSYMRIIEGLRLFIAYCNFKTLQFNFHYFSLRDALHFPVFVSRNTKFRLLKGRVRIIAPLTIGMIRIGAQEIGMFDKRHNRPVWENAGRIIFQGKALIRYGACIIVGEHGVLNLGNQFRLSSGSSIICYKSVVIGDNCRISWNCQIIDTDFHKVIDSSNNQINPDKEIRLGNYCWIGNHSMVNKGTVLNDMVVLASHSMINKNIPDCNVILAGSPARIIRRNITWHY